MKRLRHGVRACVRRRPESSNPWIYLHLSSRADIFAEDVYLCAGNHDQFNHIKTIMEVALAPKVTKSIIRSIYTHLTTAHLLFAYLERFWIFSVLPKTTRTMYQGNLPWQNCSKQTVSRSGQTFKPCHLMEYSHSQKEYRQESASMAWRVQSVKGGRISKTR